MISNQTFAICLLIEICIGFFCAHKLSANYPLWVRLIVLSPCLTAFYTLFEMVSSDIQYLAYTADFSRAGSTIALYLVLASLFTKRPWLKVYAQS